MTDDETDLRRAQMEEFAPCCPSCPSRSIQTTGVVATQPVHLPEIYGLSAFVALSRAAEDMETWVKIEVR